MKLEKKENYTLISSIKDDFTTFYPIFIKNHPTLQKEHLIVQLSNFLNISNSEILLFLNLQKQHKKNGTTFVVIYKDANVDDFPEDFNIVPTLTEAEDILEMENIERELGF